MSSNPVWRLSRDLNLKKSLPLPRVNVCTHGAEMAAMYECLYVCCISLYNIYVCIHCIQTNVCVPWYSGKGIDDVAFNKK